MVKRKNFENNNDCLFVKIWETGQVYVVGLVTLWVFSVFAVLSIPVFVYRWFLANILVKYCFSQDGIGKPVTPVGNIFALELLDNRPPRNTIVTNFVIEGTLDHKEIRERFEHRWIQATTTVEKNESEIEELKYPELQQYIDYWGGFMFWRQDNKFTIDNHLEFHRIPDAAGDEDVNSEKHFCSLVEHLLNAPFSSKRSPWEIHVVENYRNSQLLQPNAEVNNNEDDTAVTYSGEMTIFILKFHHSLADGFALLYAVVEGLFGQSISDISLANPQESSTVVPHSEMSWTSLLKVSNRLVYDIGASSIKILKKQKTPWHISDKKKCWKQLYGRSALIPIQKIKDVKNTFGVSFTATILSCVASGVQKSFESGGLPSVPYMSALTPLPRRGHPKRFQNHAAGAIFELPTGSDLNSLERLIECEKVLADAKRSTLPQWGIFFSTVVGSHFVPVAKRIFYNSWIPMGLSNFPGPGKELLWDRRKGLATDFVAGAITGIAGVGFMSVSYRGHIRIAVSAENAVMDRPRVQELIGFVEQEIDNLHRLTLSASKSQL